MFRLKGSRRVFNRYSNGMNHSMEPCSSCHYSICQCHIIRAEKDREFIKDLKVLIKRTEINEEFKELRNDLSGLLQRLEEV